MKMKLVILLILLPWSITNVSMGSEKVFSLDDKRPNVLFIVVDDLRPLLGCYGDSIAITPNIDKLAERGLVFNKAYCQQAVCAPSRASVLTGMRPDATKVWDLKTHFRKALPNVITLPQHFKQNGYEARSVGKIYHDSEQLQDPDSWSGPAALAITGQVGGKYVLDKNRPTKKSWKADATEFADVPDTDYIDGKVRVAAVEMIRELKDTSFFLAVGFRRPHLPFSAPLVYWNLYDDEDIPMPIFETRPEGTPAIAMHNSAELRGYRDVPDSGEISAEKIRELRHGYYASVSYIDAQIGFLMDELENQDLLENTVIVLLSDHGFHLGEQDLWTKATNFELDTRVPLIISVPNQDSIGLNTDALVELVDLYPTISELAKIPVPDNLEGTSLVTLLDNPSMKWKETAFSQFPRPWMYKDNPTVMGYSVRDVDYRYTEWRNVKDGSIKSVELYHYEKDGIEKRNLAGNKEYRAVQNTMQVKLRKAWR